MSLGIVIEIIALSVTLLTVAASAVWGVATIRQVVVQLRDSVTALTTSVNKLSDRIDELEHDHADTRERVARLEGSASQ